MVRELSPEKHAAILNAALKLFVANGVQGTSTAQIAQEAGIAAGTLFLYFPTKRDLINTLTVNIGRAQSEAMQARLDPNLPARETFRTIWEVTLDWFLANRAAFEYLQQVRDSGLVEPAVAQETEQFFAYYFQAIQKGHAEGCLKPYPLDLVGSILYHNLVAVMNLVKDLPDAARQGELIQAGFQIFWDGIRN